MKELDYLWDKDGTDAEIESLEAALQCFAYKELPPPELPVKRRKVAGVSLFDVFKFRFAFAALCVAVAGLGLGWYVLSGDTPDKAAVASIAEFNQPESQLSAQPNSGAAITKPEVYIAEKPAVVEISHTAVPKKKKRNVRTVLRPSRPLPQVMTAIAVTREEADAYKKLMLALSITSSKLKIVKDGVDEAEPTSGIERKERGRR